MRIELPFRLRGHEVSRIEAFSDVVFGFALTLVVVSLEVPNTFEELMEAMRGFPAFAICFAILTWVWHAHHTFFRRYALKDNITIALNAALLFMVLLYTFPLKFLFFAMTGRTHGGADVSMLFVIYGLGFAGIFGLLLALYGHAWRQRGELELNAVELHDTQTTMMMYASYVAIGLGSALIGAVASEGWMVWAGWMYFLIGPASALIGARRGVQRRLLAEAA